MARPFVSLSNMSRPPDIPEFYRRSLRRARSSNHPSRPFLGPVKRRKEEKERERRGDKGLTYRSVTRYPTRFLSFFSLSLSLFPSFSFCLVWCTRVRTSGDTLTRALLEAGKARDYKNNAVVPARIPVSSRGFKSCRKQGENIGFEIRNFFRVHRFRGGKYKYEPWRIRGSEMNQVEQVLHTR